MRKFRWDSGIQQKENLKISSGIFQKPAEISLVSQETEITISS